MILGRISFGLHVWAIMLYTAVYLNINLDVSRQIGLMETVLQNCVLLLDI